MTAAVHLYSYELHSAFYVHTAHSITPTTTSRYPLLVVNQRARSPAFYFSSSVAFEFTSLGSLCSKLLTRKKGDSSRVLSALHSVAVAFSPRAMKLDALDAGHARTVSFQSH